MILVLMHKVSIHFHLREMAEARGGIIAFIMSRTLYALRTVLDITALGIAKMGFTDTPR